MRGMRPKAVAALACVLLALVVACGGGPSESDIDATVEVNKNHVFDY
jgi:hypothetical protein